jgi:hypothetical protein
LLDGEDDHDRGGIGTPLGSESELLSIAFENEFHFGALGKGRACERFLGNGFSEYEIAVRSNHGIDLAFRPHRGVSGILHHALDPDDKSGMGFLRHREFVFQKEGNPGPNSKAMGRIFDPFGRTLEEAVFDGGCEEGIVCHFPAIEGRGPVFGTGPATIALPVGFELGCLDCSRSKAGEDEKENEQGA